MSSPLCLAHDNGFEAKDQGKKRKKQKGVTAHFVRGQKKGEKNLFFHWFDICCFLVLLGSIITRRWGDQRPCVFSLCQAGTDLCLCTGTRWESDETRQFCSAFHFESRGSFERAAQREGKGPLKPPLQLGTASKSPREPSAG